MIGGVFDPTAPGVIVFHAATVHDAPSVATVQACVRRRLLRLFVPRGLLPGIIGAGCWRKGTAILKRLRPNQRATLAGVSYPDTSRRS